MINDTNSIFNTPSRSIKGKVELYNGSTLLNTFNYNDALKSIVIDRVGESGKFFGFGICQKATIKLVDNNRQLDIVAGNSFKVYFTTGDAFVSPFPTFYVTELKRDENTNELTIIAYDALYNASTHTVSELELTAPYTTGDFLDACSALIGATRCIADNTDKYNISAYMIEYENGANFDGSESIRDALTKAAEITQSVCYISSKNELVLKKLGADSVLTITKDDYFSLNSGSTRTLNTIVHATQLGDNVSVSSGDTGETQIVWDNPFWELRDDIDTLLNNAIAAIGGATITEFNCEWRGNYLLEIGDKIDLITKDNNVISSFVLNDTISYNGGLSQTTSWEYTDNEGETATNPATLGEALKQTYAKVDKINQEITLKASKTEVEAIEGKQVTFENSVTEKITPISEKIEVITEWEENGIGKVSTATGFTFDSTGLAISKSDKEITTTITEDGMTINKNEEAVLVANNEGVKATDLHANTYLIIGNNSRFENYGTNRTGCFWIGGI